MLRRSDFYQQTKFIMSASRSKSFANKYLNTYRPYSSFHASAILNCYAENRCTLVPRLPFPVPAFSNIRHPGYLLFCYRLKFRVAYFTVKTDVTRKCWCVTNTRKKCSASKYRPSENTITVLFTRKQSQTFYFFDILIGYRDAEFRSSLYPENLILICD